MAKIKRRANGPKTLIFTQKIKPHFGSVRISYFNSGTSRVALKNPVMLRQSKEGRHSDYDNI